MMTVQELLTLLNRCHLLNAEQLVDVPTNVPDAKSLAKQLIERDWLTPYQANQLLTGRGDDLLLGSFVLLEKLGEGGMGAVFKARNWKMGRTVAVKLIRKERLTNPDAVRRFHREIRAAAQLQHPNIVGVYDADDVNGTHFMAMEYVKGQDLADYAKKHGRLPIDKACDFIRQAAVGLQHAYERGLVHRDIKPANLFLTDGGVVKVLDMGLARIEHGDADDHSSSLTAEGSIMGTPDYIAPEQAVDSKSVDIRADIYSLGCSLYYLLSGRVPFPGGSLMEKLMRHQMEQPPSILQLRPDISPGLAAIIEAMMAKLPDDRIQTPGEVAEALAEVDVTPAPEAVSSTAATVDIPGMVRPKATPAGNSLFAFDEAKTEEGIVRSSKSKPKSDSAIDPQEKRRWLMVISGLAGVLVLALVGVFALMKSGGETPEKAPAVKNKKQKDNAKQQVEKANDVKDDFEKWLIKTKNLPAREKLNAVLERLKLHNPGYDGKALHGEIENDRVVTLNLPRHSVADLSPISALSHLEQLAVAGHSSTMPDSPIVDLAPLRDLPLRKLALTNCRVLNLKPLEQLKLVELKIHQCAVPDWTPVSQMPLENLFIHGEKNLDVAALAIPTLKKLSVAHCNVSDLSRLTSLKLEELDISNTQIRDLSPIAKMPLQHLDIRNTLIRNLNPLTNLPLKYLRIENVPVTDFQPLASLPIEEIELTFEYERDSQWLKSSKSLKIINRKRIAEFWKDVEAERVAFRKWYDDVAKMPLAGRRITVELLLKVLNPSCKRGIKVTATENGRITGIEVDDANLEDLRPLRALKHLKKLTAGKSGMHTKISSLWPLKGLPLEHLEVPGSRVFDLRPLAGMRLKRLDISATPVADLKPLDAMPLQFLDCRKTQVADLAPLRHTQLSYLGADATKISDLKPLEKLPLTDLSFYGTNVENLGPLKTMQLRSLSFWNTNVEDLTPLKGMPLHTLRCGGTKVKDLSPLQVMRLTELNCSDCAIRDISVLKGMPIRRLHIDGTYVKDTAILADMPLEAYRGPIWPLSTLQMLMGHPTLSTINAVNASVFRKAYQPWHTWMQMVRILPAEKQAAAVAKKMREVNPGFDGKLETEIQDNKIAKLTFIPNNVRDLIPLLAFPDLWYLRISGDHAEQNTLQNIDVLRWMPLRNLTLHKINVPDLEPLRYLPLESLHLDVIPISDLEPLAGMPLTALAFYGSKVSDLTPLKEMKLTTIHLAGTKVTDLTPLAGMPLKSVDCRNTKVADLSPLAKAPLRVLFAADCPFLSFEPVHKHPLEGIDLDFEYERDAKWLKSVRTMKNINRMLASEFWTKIDAKRAEFEKWKKQVALLPAEEKVTAVIAKLKEMNPGYDGKAAFEIRDGKVRDFDVNTNSISDLSPIGALAHLHYLKCGGSFPKRGKIRSLWPIQHLQLQRLHCTQCQLNDLRPIRNMPLTYLFCPSTDIRDLSPLKNLPLKDVYINETLVTDIRPLKGRNIRDIELDFNPKRDTAILKSMPLLERINGLPVAEFWAKHGDGR